MTSVDIQVDGDNAHEVARFLAAALLKMEEVGSELRDETVVWDYGDYDIQTTNVTLKYLLEHEEPPTPHSGERPESVDLSAGIDLIDDIAAELPTSIREVGNTATAEPRPPTEEVGDEDEEVEVPEESPEDVLDDDDETESETESETETDTTTESDGVESDDVLLRENSVDLSRLDLGPSTIPATVLLALHEVVRETGTEGFTSSELFGYCANYYDFEWSQNRYESALSVLHDKGLVDRIDEQDQHRFRYFPTDRGRAFLSKSVLPHMDVDELRGRLNSTERYNSLGENVEEWLRTTLDSHNRSLSEAEPHDE